MRNGQNKQRMRNRNNNNNNNNNNNRRGQNPMTRVYESNGPDIKIRGTQGSVQAQTGAGSIEASFNTAPVSSHQHLATTTGNIVLAIDDRLDAELELATSSVFSTEFSLDVTPTPGQEPNKRAHTVVGEDKARIVVESRRGEIRLLRRSGFRPLDGKPAVGEYEDNDSA
jgi:DUF4097 and DUF4098 domain-containing protein YvlB